MAYRQRRLHRDHNTPTGDWDKGIQDPISKLQVDTLDKNIKEFGALAYFPFMDKGQGIVHVMGPEQGATLPGMTVVCGDSHTSTHGAFGALAHGIGTSEVEHTMATQCITAKKSKSMLIAVEGRLKPGVTAKDAPFTSSDKSARQAVRATPSSSAAKPSAAFRWKAA